MKPSVSIVLTVNNRPPEVSRQVAESLQLPGNQSDELIVVLDRPTPEARDGAIAYSEATTGHVVKYVDMQGPPGWLCPARAWNAGFKAATGELLYCTSSDVVQYPGNVARAKKIATGNTVVFGSCSNSNHRVQQGSPPGTVCSSNKPNPNGFIVCMTAESIRNIGGYDEEFMRGLCYEDADLFLRLWNSGMNFVFCDFVHGTHINHPRPELFTKKGKQKVQLNAKRFLGKYGTTSPWNEIEKIELREPGQLTWKHK